MAFKILIGMFALTMPLFAAIGLLIYMSKGKGKSAPTQTEIEEHKKQRALEKDAQ